MCEEKRVVEKDLGLSLEASHLYEVKGGERGEEREKREEGRGKRGGKREEGNGKRDQNTRVKSYLEI